LSCRHQGSPRRALVVGHAATLPRSIAVLRAVEAVDIVDVIELGRRPDGAPAPAGARRIDLPRAKPLGRMPFVVLGFAQRLLRQHYAVVAVAQPGLATSRARGLLLGFALMMTGRRPIGIDPLRHAATAPMRRRFAALDALRGLAVNVVGAVCAGLAGFAGQWLGRWVAAGTSAPPLDGRGRVLYLRTDIDLARQPLEAGGSLAHTHGILGALQRRGHDVELWSTGNIAGVPGSIIQRRLPVVLRPNLPRELAEAATGFLQAVRVTTEGLDDVAFVYQRYSLNNLLGAILAVRLRVPLVLEANASEVTWRREWSRLEHGRLAEATERVNFLRASRIAVVSRNARADLQRSGADPSRTHVIPNGVDVERFYGVPPRSLGLPDGSFVVMFCGLFYPWHGVRHLAAAFPRVLEQVPHARLVLVGDGEEASLARSLLEHAGVGDHVVITGLVPREAVPGYLAAADVLVSPHVRNDSFIGSPIKLWEYMAAGRAIVATRVAQLAEVLEDGRTALLVDPDDPEQLSAAIARLAHDASLRHALGARATEEARLLHSWDARLTATLEGHDA
jgi:glycosyltransferase involved in cell wall biosynthesis